MSVSVEPLTSWGRWAEQAAALLQICFPDEFGYPTEEASTAEIRELLANAVRLLAAVDGRSLVGLIGALSTYRGRVWELHPLAVRPDRQRRGIGRMLVEALEREAQGAGAEVITLGTDDTDGRTSLAGVDLFPGVLGNLLELRDHGGHPFAFYRRLGYEVVGVVPDGNGFGRPDILMAKRVVDRNRE